MRSATIALAPWAVALLLRLWAGASPEQVERLYARGAYPVIAAALDRLSGWTAASLAEIGCVVLPVLALAYAWHVMRRPGPAGRGRRVGQLLARGAGLLGAVYSVFLLLWGLNYERAPVASMLGLDTRPSSTRELLTLSEELVARANALREGLLEDETGAVRLRQGRPEVLHQVVLGFDGLGARLTDSRRAGGRVKTPVCSPLLAYLGVAGIYMPFTGEPHLNGTLPDSEIPFTASHEMAHRYGFAREDEANYVGYLACRAHPDGEFRYSGALRASLYAVSALHGVDAPAARGLQAARSPAVRRDLAALAAWHRRYASRAAEVQRRVNDAYLRSQGQEHGVRSYGRMIDLLLAERRQAPSSP